MFRRIDTKNKVWTEKKGRKRKNTHQRSISHPPLTRVVGVFTVRFGSVFIKKSNQTEFFFLKKTETEPKPVQTDRFRFGLVFQSKNRFGSVFSVWLCFFRFGSVFSVWLGSGSVWLGFLSGFFRFCSIFPVLGLKNRNRTGRFFQNFNRFNRFFFTVRFFRLLFFRFSRFNRFFGHP